MANTDTITQARLKELLTYDPDNGLFIWNESRGPLFKGTVAGSIKHSGYIHIQIDKTVCMAHRLAFLYMTGEYPEETDHINHNKADNSFANLREVTHRENMRNQKIRSNNTSGMQGVTYNKRCKKWQAWIMDQKRVHLGLFSQLNDAKKARRIAEDSLGFHDNHGAKT